MAVTDWKYPGTAANVTESTNAPWANPNYAKADDTSYSYGYLKNAVTDTLRLTNYGFTSSDIPSGATINGVEIVSGISGEQNVGSCTDSIFYLRKSSGQTGNNIASAVTWPGTNGTVISERTYGGSTDMSGTSLTQSDIVASTFGLDLRVSCGSGGGYVDYIKIRVYYTEGGASVKPYYYYLNQ